MRTGIFGDVAKMKKERIKASKFETGAFIGSESYVWLLNYWLPTRRTRQQNEHHLQAIPLANR